MSKLAFLDPEQKKVIPLGNAISLLKFSGLPPVIQKKILDNLKLTRIFFAYELRKSKFIVYRHEKNFARSCSSTK